MFCPFAEGTTHEPPSASNAAPCEHTEHRRWHSSDAADEQSDAGSGDGDGVGAINGLKHRHEEL